MLKVFGEKTGDWGVGVRSWGLVRGVEDCVGEMLGLGVRGEGPVTRSASVSKHYYSGWRKILVSVTGSLELLSEGQTAMQAVRSFQSCMEHYSTISSQVNYQQKG